MENVVNSAERLSNSEVLTLKQGKVNNKLTKLLVSTSGRLFKVVRMKVGKFKPEVATTIDPIQYRPGLDLLVEVKPCYNKCGYQQVHVKFTDGSYTTVQVGRLVLETFVDIPQDIIDPQCQHKDHNRANNNLSNLEWLSREDNNKDRRRVGRPKKITYI